MTDWIVSVDLGKTQDYTAIVCLEVVRIATGKTRRNRKGAIVEEYRAEYHVRHIDRPPLRTSYADIVARVSGLLGSKELRDSDVEFIVDGTGVGNAVVEMFRGAGMSPAEIVITSGLDAKRDDDGRYHVPKRDLAGVLQVLLPSGRLRVATGLELTKTLEKELRTFRVKQRATGASYESARDGDHDDIVLAVAMACWYAEHSCGRFSRWFQATDPKVGSVAWNEEQKRQIRRSLTRSGKTKGPWYKISKTW